MDKTCFVCCAEIREEVLLIGEQEDTLLLLCEILELPHLGKDIQKFENISYCRTCSRGISNIRDWLEELEKLESKIIEEKNKLEFKVKENKFENGNRNYDVLNPSDKFRHEILTELRSRNIRNMLGRIGKKQIGRNRGKIRTLKNVTISKNILTATQPNSDCRLQKNMPLTPEGLISPTSTPAFPPSASTSTQNQYQISVPGAVGYVEIGSQVSSSSLQEMNLQFNTPVITDYFSIHDGNLNVSSNSDHRQNLAPRPNSNLDAEALDSTAPISKPMSKSQNYTRSKTSNRKKLPRSSKPNSKSQACNSRNPPEIVTLQQDDIGSTQEVEQGKTFKRRRIPSPSSSSSSQTGMDEPGKTGEGTKTIHRSGIEMNKKSTEKSINLPGIIVLDSDYQPCIDDRNGNIDIGSAYPQRQRQVSPNLLDENGLLWPVEDELSPCLGASTISVSGKKSKNSKRFVHPGKRVKWDNNKKKLCEIKDPAEVEESESETTSRSCTLSDEEIEDVVVSIKARRKKSVEMEDEDVSTSSSESIPEAHNAIDKFDLVDLEEEEDLKSADPMSTLGVPLLEDRYKNYDKHLHMEIHSKTEFSLKIYIEHHITYRQIIQYPMKLIKKFEKRFSSAEGRYEQNNGQFIFQTKINIYLKLMDLCKPFHLISRDEDVNQFEMVIVALSRYYQLNNSCPSNDYYLIAEKLKKFKKLREYQKESVAFAIRRQGRCMMADDSRMGKGVEAIVASTYYQDEWPLLVMCATSLQDDWNSELRKWLPRNLLKVLEIKILTNEEECKKISEQRMAPDITIIGYKLLQGGAKYLKNKNFKVVIIDESHKIKHALTKTTKAARQIIRRAKRRFLLTANPAFGVPEELFRQLHVIDREAFKNYIDFADRYCGTKDEFDGNGEIRTVASRCWRNAINVSELNHLLRGTVMIRHHFEDIPNLILPQKFREKVILDFQPDAKLKCILGKYFDMSRKNLKEIEEDRDTNSTKVFRWFMKSGIAKLMLICQYLNELDFASKKIVIYGRHKSVLKGIGKFLKRKGIAYVRIHGSYEKREEESTDFNTKNKIRVALVSLNIVDMCAELSAADLVVFTELYWIPDALFRNENRVCQLNKLFKAGATQKKFEIKYLIAQEKGLEIREQIHFDIHLWEMLLGKMDVLTRMGLLSGQNNFSARDIPEVDFIPNPKAKFDDDFLTNCSPTFESDSEEYNPSEDGENSTPDSDSNVSSVASEDLSEHVDDSSDTDVDDSQVNGTEEDSSEENVENLSNSVEQEVEEEENENSSKASEHDRNQENSSEDEKNKRSVQSEGSSSSFEEMRVVLTPGRTRSQTAKVLGPKKFRHKGDESQSEDGQDDEGDDDDENDDDEEEDVDESSDSEGLGDFIDDVVVRSGERS